MTNLEIMKHWIESSDDDYDVMITLYKGEKYAWCLFVGHLVIEKLVKAIYSKRNSENPHAPKIHNIITIADKCNLELDDKKRDILGIINTFNIGARYDDYRKEFNNKCTKEYTDEQIKNIKELRKWLKTQLM